MVNSIEITDRILITALIASLKDQKQSFSQKELLDSDFSPTDGLSLQAIDQLIKTGLVKIKEKPEDLQATYELNIPNNEQSLRTLIGSLKGDHEEGREKIRQLVFDVLSAECIEYIISEMKEKKLIIKSDSKPPQRLFELLSAHSSAEVHMLLWQTMKRFNNSDFRILMATESHSDVIDQVIDEAYKSHERYLYFKRSIKSFKRNADYRNTVINKILFSKHLDYGLEYFNDLRL
ncbi:MAG: hypothetical protein JKX82_09445 [Oleispira sp.]|nr:hypothetical protein [Oleispira sp.]